MGLRRRRPVQRHRPGRVGGAVVLDGGVSTEARLRRPWRRWGTRGGDLAGEKSVLLPRYGVERSNFLDLITREL